MEFGETMKITLNKISNFLSSDVGESKVKSLHKQLSEHGAEIDGKCVGPIACTKMPDDVFEHVITSFLYGSFLRKCEVNAAISNGVVHAYAHIADANGVVDIDEAGEILGKKAQDLLVEISKNKDDETTLSPRQKLIISILF